MATATLTRAPSEYLKQVWFDVVSVNPPPWNEAVEAPAGRAIVTVLSV